MSEIKCKKCGDETNHVPPDLPSDWDGYCPACAVSLALAGEISGKDDAKNYLIARAMDSISEGNAIVVAVPAGAIAGLLGGTPPDSGNCPGEIIDTPSGHVFYGQN